MAMFCLSVCCYTEKRNIIKTSFFVDCFLYLVHVLSSSVLTIFNLAFDGKEKEIELCSPFFSVSGFHFGSTGKEVDKNHLDDAI